MNNVYLFSKNLIINLPNNESIFIDDEFAIELSEHTKIACQPDWIPNVLFSNIYNSFSANPVHGTKIAQLLIKDNIKYLILPVDLNIIKNNIKMTLIKKIIVPLPKNIIVTIMANTMLKVYYNKVGLYGSIIFLNNSNAYLTFEENNNLIECIV